MKTETIELGDSNGVGSDSRSNHDGRSCNPSNRKSAGGVSEPAPSGQVTGRLLRPPNPALFKLLYEQQTARDQVDVLPHLLQIDAAHVVMLAHAKLLPMKVAGGLLRVNREMNILLDEGKDVVSPKPEHRGLYSLYEQEYIHRLGKQVGGAAHMARSRNDINATVTRLRLRDDLLTLLAEFCKLSHVMCEASERYSDTVMCGFTHLQPAQPSTLGHYLVGVLAELMRSAEVLDRAFDVVNCSPMGAAAGFGTSFAIDRGEVAQFLGFSAIIENSIDAVASRDYLIQALSGEAALGVTLTRLATDFQAWSSAAYGFLGWPDDLVSTSSIMPQKRNAFVLENIRGQAMDPLGSLVNTVAGMKNVPFSNSVEMSAEATAHIWPATKALLQALQLTRLLLEHLQVHSQRMLGFLTGANTTMSAVTDFLVARHGLSFRTAHDCVSVLVNQYEVTPSAAEIKQALERIVADQEGISLNVDQTELALALDPGECTRAAAYGGGPSFVAVRAQRHSLICRAGSIEKRLKIRRRCLLNAALQLQAAVDEIVDVKPGNADNALPLAEREQSREPAKAIGMGHCPLVLGECVQGQTKEHRYFLITSPIGLFSWAEFVPDYEDRRLIVEPADHVKAHAAVEAYLVEQELPPHGILRVFTPIGPGQGFGTSTADITASLRAVAAAWNRTISADIIARIAIGIEPSDGSMYSGCVAFAHLEGVLLERLGSLPPFEALVVCTGGVVDTLEFNKRRTHFRYSERDKGQLMDAWKMVRCANQTRDASLLARAASMSAMINEQFLPKPYFTDLVRFVELGGAEGIMVAHSGTALGLILDPARFDYPARMAEAKDFLASLKPPAWFQISNRMIYQQVLSKHVTDAATLYGPQLPASACAKTIV
jgi:argininosuccinate lyase